MKNNKLFISRILSGVLCLAFVLSFIPATVFASNIITLTRTDKITIPDDRYDGTTFTGTISDSQGCFVVQQGADAEITFEDLSISRSLEPGILVTGNSTLRLTIKGTVNIEGGSFGAGIKVSQGSKLIITSASTGTLNVKGGATHPAIGSKEAVGTIEINGGTINATGRNLLYPSGARETTAAIGGSGEITSGHIIINGGTVNATAYGNSAAIGGTTRGEMESITINGGTVNANIESGSDASAIGGGGGAPGNGKIYINGGVVSTNGPIGASKGAVNKNTVLTMEDDALVRATGIQEVGQTNANTCNVKISINDTKLLEDKNVTATLSVDGKFSFEHNATLKVSNYNGTISIPTFIRPSSNMGETLKVQVTDGTNTWSGSAVMAATTNVVIGEPFRQAELLFVSQEITADISDYDITVKKGNTTLVPGKDYIAGVLKNTETNAGVIAIQIPEGTYAVSVKTASLNSGAAMTGTLTVVSGDVNRLVLLNEVASSISEELYLDYGPIQFGEENGAGYVAYYDENGAQKKINGIPSVLEVPISQKNTTEHTENTITVTGGSFLIRLKNLNVANTNYSDIAGRRPTIQINGNGHITLVIDGDNIIQNGEFNPVIYAPSAKLTLKGNGALTVAPYVLPSGSLGSTLGIEANEIVIDGPTVHATGSTSSLQKETAIKGNTSVTIEDGVVNATGGFQGAGISAPFITINGGEVTAVATGIAAGIGGVYKDGTNYTITINGGKVNATGGSGSAAIGSADESTGSLSITINGGIVNATAGTYGAGIGGAQGRDGGTITITGGTVTAISDESNGGSGIGGGDEGDGGTITISGGTITATAGMSSAGIGGGAGKKSGKITISGGTIVANGKGTGIGGGNSAQDVDVTISGGTITATGGNSYAGIGNGFSYNNRNCIGTVNISGGTIIATGGSNAAGIGSGYWGRGLTITITGGNVLAKAGSGAAAIGAGKAGSTPGTLQDAAGNNLQLNKFTLTGAAADTVITNIAGVTYGLNDVKTLDTNVLYFYLPANAEVSTITTDGTVYTCMCSDLTCYASHDWSNKDGVCANGCGFNCTHTVQGGVCGICGKLLHTHNWEYSVSVDKTSIAAACVAEGCDIVHGGSVTIVLPADVIYNGEAKDASLVFENWQFGEETKPVLRYNDVDRVNVTGEDIEAYIELGGVKAQASYRVAPTSIEGAVISVDDGIYTGEALTPEVAVQLSGKTLTKDADFGVTYSDNTNAGTALVTVTGMGNYIGTITKTFEIAKAAPAYNVPTELTATYGDTLADVTLPKGFTWQDAETISVGNAGDRTFKVTYTPADTDNLLVVTDIEVTIAVAKADPEYTMPEDLVGYVGQLWRDIPLPEGWSFHPSILDVEDPFAVQDIGTCSFNGYFTPADTDNYNVIEVQGIPVKILARLSDVVVTVEDRIYTGSAVTSKVVVKIGEETLKEGEDYTVSYSGNVNVGTATVTITAVDGRSVGTATATFAIICDHTHNTGKEMPNADGLTHSVTCSVCQEIISTNDHTGGRATCTEKAACEICGASYGETLAENHSFDDGIIVNAPTCTDKGLIIYTCTRCATTKPMILPANGHTHSEVKEIVVFAPTCIATGLKQTLVDCTVCGLNIINEVQKLPALGHTGDLNGDDKTDNDDVELLLWCTLFPAETEDIETCVDYNHDDKVDNVDVLALLWHCLFPEDFPL